MSYSKSEVDLYVGLNKKGNVEVRRLPSRAEYSEQTPRDLPVQLVAQVHKALVQLRSFPNGRQHLLWISPGINDLYEVSPEELASDPVRLIERIHPEDRDAFLSHWLKCQKTPTPFDSEFRVVLPGERESVFHCQMAPEQQTDKSIIWHGVVIDVSEQKADETRMQIARELYQHNQQGLVILSPRGKILNVNDTFTKLTGFTREESVGKTSKILRSKLYPPSFYETMWASLEANGRWEGEFNERRKDGTLCPQWLTISGIHDADGKVSHWVAQFFDISQIKEAEDIIWRQANYDDLTELPNRRMFFDRLGQAIKTLHRTNRQIALFSIDLDHFKTVNDTLGHAVGDELLVQAGVRIMKCIREGDTLARFGGDEFVIFIEYSRLSIIERIAGNILEALSQPFELGQERVFLGGSIGISVYPRDADSINGMLRCADQAMYAAKQRGRNCFEYFTPSMQAAARQRMQMINELRQALEKEQLWVAYQPIIDLGNRRIVKAEALVRWQHPVMGEVSPVNFIPLAEDTGLIMAIGEFVLSAVAQQLAQWREMYPGDFQISVNVSPIQLQSNDRPVFDYWEQCIESHGLSGSDITMEITEGLLLNERPEVKQQLLAFRNAGIEVAVDDFGTGYSSLSYLKKLHIDYLKIDRSFVHQLESDNDNMAVCEAIIVMAGKLGLQVIAEGIETEQQMSLLKSAGCDFGQGYLFSKPVNAESFGELLGKRQL
ncbi:MAG: EAL domain-containing protein [Pseudomonadales bacterium]|nr:EAL domain-containing protein [Pseudomonadales bacterium]MCP5301951.1 EAL domain-containing protein [Pseudomonadales bacterium]